MYHWKICIIETCKRHCLQNFLFIAVTPHPVYEPKTSSHSKAVRRRCLTCVGVYLKSPCYSVGMKLSNFTYFSISRRTKNIEFTCQCIVYKQKMRRKQEMNSQFYVKCHTMIVKVIICRRAVIFFKFTFKCSIV